MKKEECRMKKSDQALARAGRFLHSSFCLLPFFIFLVRLYRWTLSPAKTVLFGPLGQCRFTPSCSEYALEALQTHGPAAGSWLAVKRVCRCHPWGGCGHDPVPEMRSGARCEDSRIPHPTPRIS
jgi:putative membrane protein insertion efficiency factor